MRYPLTRQGRARREWLGSVDALSGQIDLIEQCRARGAPAGRYVPALGTRVYWGLGASATAT